MNLSHLFAYDDWANREVLASLQAAPAVSSRSIKLLAHIFAAERLWLERLQQQEQTLPVWPEFTLQQCQQQARELPAVWRNYLERRDAADLALTVSYKNTKGENWTSRKSDILMHVVMHSAYHRGQIASDMRASGLTPAYTDFIHGVRQCLIE